MTHKNRKKSRIFMFLSTGCSLLRAEGFSCSLGFLYGGLGIGKFKFLIKKIEIKFPAINFFLILGHQTLDPDPGSGSAIRKNTGSGSVSGSALNQCGSETLIRIQELCCTHLLTFYHCCCLFSCDIQYSWRCTCIKTWWEAWREATPGC
jgi:hypothetical protein